MSGEGRKRAGRWTPPAPWSRRSPQRALRPPAYSAHQYRALVAFLGVTSLLTVVFVHGQFGFDVLDEWLIYSIAAIGFYLVFVVAGRFAFCQTTMMATAAYTAAYVSRSHDFYLGLLAGIGVVVALALVFGILVARAEDFYFAVATIALTQVGVTVFTNWSAFTGPDGIASNVPYPSVFGLQLATEGQIFWLLLAALALVILVSTLLQRSPVFREATAAREVELVALSSGVTTRRVQLTIFVLGSAMGGLAGALSAYWQGSVTSDAFGIDLAIGIFLMPLVGGVGSIWGPVAGALFYVGLPQVLSFVANYTSLIYGIVLVVTIIVVPDGLIGGLHRLVLRLAGSPASDGPLGWRAILERRSGARR